MCLPMIAQLARTTHVVSAFWVLVLAAIIFVDVMGRYLFSQPLLGATEVIANSVVSITFLQLPLAIYRGGMIRSTLLYDAVGATARRWLRTLAGVLGLAFFLGTAFSAWGPALEALAVSEYEGEGALRVPTYPVRFLVVATSIFAAYVYLHLLYGDWTGRLGPRQEAEAGQAPEASQASGSERESEPGQTPEPGQKPGPGLRLEPEPEPESSRALDPEPESEREQKPEPASPVP